MQTKKAKAFTDYMRMHYEAGGEEAALKWCAGHLGLLTYAVDKLQRENKRLIKRVKKFESLSKTSKG